MIKKTEEKFDPHSMEDVVRKIEMRRRKDKSELLEFKRKNRSEMLKSSEETAKEKKAEVDQLIK